MARSGPPPKLSDSVVVPFQQRWRGHILSFISTIMVFGTPVDITLSELGLEAFMVTGQTYPRKQDWLVAAALGSLASSLYKFAFDLRLLQSPPMRWRR